GASCYFKLQDGENRIRILSRPVLGWEEWTKEKKPVRYAMDEKPTVFIDEEKKPKHFWAFIVWNVLEKQIQIMQVTQATIRNKIEELTKDQEWGCPFEYDLKISKSGSGIETKYIINQVPHKKVSQEILDAFHDRPINL